MTPKNKQVCGDCVHCVEGDLNPQDLRQHPYNCYALPPGSSAIPTQQGVAVMTTRPVINRGDIACSMFSSSIRAVTN